MRANPAPARPADSPSSHGSALALSMEICPYGSDTPFLFQHPVTHSRKHKNVNPEASRDVP